MLFDSFVSALVTKATWIIFGNVGCQFTFGLRNLKPTKVIKRNQKTFRTTTYLFSERVTVLFHFVDRVLHRQNVHLQRGLLLERRILKEHLKLSPKNNLKVKILKIISELKT
jgi:hypothetical protein